MAKLQFTLLEHEAEVDALRRVVGKPFSKYFHTAYHADLREGERRRTEAMLAEHEREWQRERESLLEEIACIAKQRMDPLQREMELLQEENQRMQVRHGRHACNNAYVRHGNLILVLGAAEFNAAVAVATPDVYRASLSAF